MFSHPQFRWDENIIIRFYPLNSRFPIDCRIKYDGRVVGSAVGSACLEWLLCVTCFKPVTSTCVGISARVISLAPTVYAHSIGFVAHPPF